VQGQKAHLDSLVCEVSRRVPVTDTVFSRDWRWPGRGLVPVLLLKTLEALAEGGALVHDALPPASTP